MAEVETSAQQGQGDEVPEITQEEQGQTLAQPKLASAPSPQPDASVPSSSVLGTEVPPPPPPAPGWAATGWTEEMEVSLTGSSIREEHRAQIGVALQGFRSVEVGMHEVFKSLIKSYEVSTSAPNSTSEEIAEMNRKLERSEKDLELMNRQVEQSQAVVAKLSKAWKDATTCELRW